MEGVLGLLFPLTYIVFLILERLFPARALAAVPYWRVKGFCFFLLGGAIVNTLPLLWRDWVNAHRLIDLDSWGIAGGAAAAIVFSNLLDWCRHRLQHALPVLWRFHQMHHSAERLEVATAFYFHPIDTIGYTLVSTFLAAYVVGVNVEAAILSGYFLFASTIFTHANIRSPHWLGYLISRPEAHAVHHQTGVHRYNYSSLPLWDMLFGTFRNPREWNHSSGFWLGASSRLGDLLLGKNVTSRPASHNEPAAELLRQAD
ncbi:sterol desaturase family protein [Massilia sp. BJB1822]|uniref:sterol desaturase family protein n=1 Tax=Massilia sp. BJB1822 TaxID=2744470 RepID=UPI001593DB77|nr:sterol desaturase family protein [Massilia sp. BJB1822]NVD98815.1 sterol desaturase family protein [Massilia sp. BJB1822]